MDLQKEREAFEAVTNIYHCIYNADLNYYFSGSKFVGDKAEIEVNAGWKAWQAAKAQAIPEGFVLVPTEKVKYFSHDGENYEIHNTLAEAKHEAECAIEHFSERLADQLCDPRSDGNFHDVGYGIVLGKSGYSVDHIVTQEDVENGEYGYEVGTEIMSLFLIEAVEPAND